MCWQTRTSTGAYDHVIFDTAPTGHTIRLLQLPGSWTDFLEAGKGDASCLGPLAGLDKQRATYAAAVGALKDPTRTRLILVARAQASSLTEIDRTNEELGQIGIHATHVVVNGVLPPEAGEEDLAVAVRARERDVLAKLPKGVAALPRDLVDLRPGNMVGLPALRSLLATSPIDVAVPDAALTSLPVFPVPWVRSSTRSRRTTTVWSCAWAKAGSARPPSPLPSRSPSPTAATPCTSPRPTPRHTSRRRCTEPSTGLRVSRIDPVQATQEYRDRIMATRGKDLDEAGRANLAEDLLSPCTEEVAVFQQFSKAVYESRREFVVIDTAPTGHTLLLLDAAGSYHRDVVRQMGDSMSFTTPLMRLQDPEQTKVILVTLAEPTPVTEARVLQADLERAGIHPWAWVVNNSLLAAEPESSFLRARAASEVEQIDAVRALAARVAVVPLLADEVVGEACLAALVEERQRQPLG